MTNPNWSQPSHASAEVQADMRERLKGLEVSAHHAQHLMQRKGERLDRMSHRLKSTEAWVAEVQARANTAHDIVPTVTDINNRLTRLERTLSQIHTGWTLLRGIGNTLGTALLVWLLLSGHLSTDGVAQLTKLLGL